MEEDGRRLDEHKDEYEYYTLYNRNNAGDRNTKQVGNV